MNKRFYLKNRKDLVEAIGGYPFLVILGSGEEVVKSEDENYDYQVNNNFYYLTGIKQPNSYLVMICEEDLFYECLYIDGYDENFEKWHGHRLTFEEASEISGIPKSNIEDSKKLFDDVEKMFDDENFKTVYFDYNNKRFNPIDVLGLMPLLKRKRPLVSDIYNDIVKLRMSKQPCEIRSLKKAIEITKNGIYRMMKEAKPNMYEYNLEAYFDFEIKNSGYKDLSFKSIIAGGNNATTLHYSENNTMILDQQLVLFDLGCKVDGYCADISRTIPINGKFTPLQRKIYRIVLKANKLVASNAKANMTLRELQKMTKDFLAKECVKANLIRYEEEIDEYYFHSVSHHIGLDAHDPFLDTPLPVNAVISNEPGLYFKKLGIGIRIEDDLLIKKSHSVNLSKNIIKSIKDIENFMNKEDEQ